MLFRISVKYIVMYSKNKMKFDDNLLTLYSFEHKKLTALIAQQIKHLRRLVIELIEIKKPTWENFIEPLSQDMEILSRMWSVVAHQHGVLDCKEVRALYNKLLPKITEIFSELGQNNQIYYQYIKIFRSAEFKKLSKSRQHSIKHAIRNFKLSGVGLSAVEQRRFIEISKKLAELSGKFDENLLDATNAFVLYSQGGSEVSGIPENILQIASENLISENKQSEKTSKPAGVKYKFTLDPIICQTINEFADDRNLRKTFFMNNMVRASGFNFAGKKVNNKFDNSKIISEILKLRLAKAKLLKFNTYAELSLADKMAKTPKEAENLLIRLSNYAIAQAKSNLSLIIEKAKELGYGELEIWDVNYLLRKIREEKFVFDQKMVKEYFPLDAVLAGLFTLLNRLFDIKFVEEKVPIWHSDIRFYRLITQQGKKLGGVFCDFFSRSSKRGGAWMDEAIARGQVGDKYYFPIAQLVCNFTPPSRKYPSLLSHDDIITLLHEFGHVLHHVLSEVDELSITGTRAVEWDAVELPSQWLEEFAWDYDLLKSMSKNINTSAILPKNLFDKILAAKNFNSGLANLRQITFGLFDLAIHNTNKKVDVYKTQSKILKTSCLYKLPSFYTFAHSFSHIFAGSYAAGYYSYKWAELLARDAFALLSEQKGPNKNFREVGDKFRQEILAVGGSRPALESFVSLRGRKPQIKHLITSYGFGKS